jgi:hypothetical protein
MNSQFPCISQWRQQCQNQQRWSYPVTANDTGLSGYNIRQREVIPLEQQRLACSFCKRVREAIA